VRGWNIVVNTTSGKEYYFIEEAISELSAGNQITNRMDLTGGLWIGPTWVGSPRIWINRNYITTIAIRKEVNDEKAVS